MSKKQDLMMDSGAFSVWGIGAEIDLDAYIEFIREYSDAIDVIVSLDVIAGQRGEKRKPTATETEEACQAGWGNYIKMLKAGLPREKIVPVFHQFDDFKWLKLFVEEKIPYIGLSTKKFLATRQQHRQWLDLCMKYVTDGDGNPICKLHGFGMTSVPLIKRYPWKSVDSTSALRSAMFGSVMTPWRTKDGWNFLKSPRQVSISTKSGNVSKFNSHISNYTGTIRKFVLQYLNEVDYEMGESKYHKKPLDYKPGDDESVFEKHKEHNIIEKIIVPGLTNSLYLRVLFNMMFFDKVEDQLVKKRQPFNKKGKRLIGIIEETEVEQEAVDVGNCNIYVAGGSNASLMTARHRLLTYHSLVSASGPDFKEFEKAVKTRRKQNGRKKTRRSK